MNYNSNNDMVCKLKFDNLSILCFHAFYQFTNKCVPVVDNPIGICEKNILFNSCGFKKETSEMTFFFLKTLITLLPICATSVDVDLFLLEPNYEDV
jgi:hypothetical protein